MINCYSSKTDSLPLDNLREIILIYFVLKSKTVREKVYLKES